MITRRCDQFWALFFFFLLFSPFLSVFLQQGIADVEVKGSSAEIPVLSWFFLLKPQIGHSIATHALPAARNSVVPISALPAFLGSASGFFPQSSDTV